MGGSTKLSTTVITKELGVQYRAEKETFTGTGVSNAGVTAVTSSSERVEVDLNANDGQKEDEQQEAEEGIEEMYEQFTALMF